MKTSLRASPGFSSRLTTDLGGTHQSDVSFPIEIQILAADRTELAKFLRPGMTRWWLTERGFQVETGGREHDAGEWSGNYAAVIVTPTDRERSGQ